MDAKEQAELIEFGHRGGAVPKNMPGAAMAINPNRPGSARDARFSYQPGTAWKVKPFRYSVSGTVGMTG